VVVTFDDAYRSVLGVSYPILAQLGLPDTVFVPTRFAGRDEPMPWPGIDEWLGGTHERELYPLGWDELRRLGEAGWEIGSHTVSHPKLTQVDEPTLAPSCASRRTPAKPSWACRAARSPTHTAMSTRASRAPPALPATPRAQRFPRAAAIIPDARRAGSRAHRRGHRDHGGELRLVDDVARFVVADRTLR